MPDYPATGKRTLQDDGSWLQTLTRDDVDLVRAGIARIEADAVVTEDGERHQCDVIVYATASPQRLRQSEGLTRRIARTRRADRRVAQGRRCASRGRGNALGVWVVALPRLRACA